METGSDSNMVINKNMKEGENHDKLYSILLDVQKQIGNLGNETSRQSEMLISIDQQVKRTNGRVTLLESDNVTTKEFITGLKMKIALVVSLVSFAWLIAGDWVKRQIGL